MEVSEEMEQFVDGGDFITLDGPYRPDMEKGDKIAFMVTTEVPIVTPDKPVG